MTKEEQYKQKLAEIIKWIEASKEEFVGETYFNARMLIESINKLIK